MSLTYSGVEPQPSLAWQFESSNVDSVTGLAPSSQVSPGPAQLVGSAALVTNAPTSNTAVYFPSTGSPYMDLGASSPAAVNAKTSNIFVECWIYQVNSTGSQGIIGTSQYSQQWVLQLVGGTPNLYVQGPGGGNFTSSIPLTAWTHVAFSWALGPSSNTAYFYINGAASGSATSTTPVAGNLGNAVIGNVNAAMFNGYIRDLRVVQGGVVPTTSFTPGSAPFSYTLPSYVTGSGSVVFTLLGQFITYPTGKYGTSIYFNNKNATASGTANASTTYNISSSSITANNASYSVWIKPYYAFPVSGLGQTAFRFTDSQTVYELDFNSGVNQSQLFFYASSTPGVTITTGVNLTTQTWYHYSVVLSNVNMTASNTSVAFYFNGTQYGATSNVARTGISLIQTVVLAAGGAGGSNGFWGELDDLRIYNTALTAAQVQSVYSSQGAPAPSRAMPLPQLAWDFQSSNVDYVSSLSPTAMVGTPTYTNGKYRQAIQFTNTPPTSSQALYYTIPSSVGSMVNGLTVSFWLNPQSLPNAQNQTYVYIDGPMVGSTGAFWMFMNNGNTTTALLYGQNPSAGGYFPGVNGPTVPQGSWTHMTGVWTPYNGFSNVMTLYVNGVFAQSIYYANAFTINRLTLATNAGGRGSPCIIDDLRIFDRALTSAQVQSIYNQQGVPGRGVVQALQYSNISAPTLYSFSSQIFSNAQATSNIGPTQSQLNTVYPSLAPTYLTSNTGIQTWTVPLTGTYSIVAAGAAGGTGSSGGGTAGRGVIVGCQAIFQKNQVISIIVGQAGVSAALQTTSNIGGGGGGGSFIVDYSTGYLYIAAGGGGGASAQGNSPSGFDASFGQDGVNGTGVGRSGVNVSPGGTGGNGGASFPGGGSNGNAGGGGGGFYTNGGQVFSGQPGQGGFAVLNGAQGGLSSNVLNFTNSFGGFGGGGGSGGNSQVVISNGAGGGGGGGYSGGGAGSRAGLGAGGGGSYVPLGQTMTQIGYCTSNGYVSINYLAPVAVKLTGTPLFSQLSSGATSSAVGAFSLRAVNGVTAKAVNVAPGGTFPPSAMTQTGTNSSTQTLGTGGKLQGSYIASSSTSAYGWGASGAFGLTTGQPYLWQVGNYPAGGGTVSTPTTTTTGATNYNGEWLQFQTPFPINLTGYSTATGFLTSFVLLASTTGATSSWILVDSKSAITVDSVITNTGLNFAGYSYFRFVVITSTTNYPLLANVRFFGTVPSLVQDFYADRLGNLLTAPVTGQSLANWLGGATGYVTTWYDQSGAGNHATQSTAANQPIIQRATKGPGYMILFNGVNGTTSYGLNFGAYNLLNNTSYSTCGVVRRTASGATNNENYYLSGSGGAGVQDQYFHSGYRTSTQLTLAHYSDDMGVTTPAFTAAATEPINYNLMTLGTDKVGRIYSYSGGTLYPTPTSTRTYVGFLNHPVGASLSIGGGFRQFTGEMYEVLVFTQSLYDLDNTGGLITQIYNNQLSYTGT